MSLPALVIALALSADDGISLETQAQIEREQQKAQDEVARKYGNKKSSELSPDERRQMIKDQAEAERQVLEKAGVDPKQYARDSIKRSRSDYAKQKELVKELVDKEKAAAAEALKKANEKLKEKDVQVQRGISDENPVTLDEQENTDGKPSVEQGLPSDADADQAAAQEQDRLENMGSAESAPKPTSKGGKSGGKKR